MLSFPGCKINLGLYVTNRRSDGYHDLETIFYPLPLCDVLEMIPAAETAVHMTGLKIEGVTADNLVMKAYELLWGKFPGKLENMHIFLHKIIPMGAGLGGGSADGAFMLKMLNSYYQLGLSNSDLADCALQLGSDCPFFIYNSPMFATGRGEKMTHIHIDLSGYSILLICPDVHVSTRQAFQHIIPKAAPFPLVKLAQLPIAEWKNVVCNDFEEPIFKLFPVLATIKEQLYNGGASYAAMTGSGSGIYGIFPKGQRAEVTVDIAHTHYYID
jgi:4-diphosphocytidyl-2-C-methyl-D-erythritol kinase